MLTYQLQRRIFKIADGAPWIFPNDIAIEFWFDPQEPFGTRHGYSRTALQSVKAGVLINANNGFSSIRPETPLDPVSAAVHYENIKYDLRGNKLYVQCRCESGSDLDQLMYQIHGLLPPILSIFIYEPPFITMVCGKVGETAFRWELAVINPKFKITSNEHHDSDLHEALMLYGSSLGSDRYRIHAALGYFYKACRLLTAGNGPWEFMPEAILNLTKSLEILFDTPSGTAVRGEKGSRDRIRRSLKSVGVDPQLVEDVFIRITILRSEFDVAHGRLALHDMEDLQLIYGFLIMAEDEFRKLLNQIVIGLSTGAITLPQYAPETEVAYSKSLRGVIEALRTKEQSTQDALG